MGGVSSSVQPQTMASFLPILVGEAKYSIDWLSFERGATDDQLLTWAGKIQEVFAVLRRAVNETKQISLNPELCQTQLEELAKWGRRAYQQFLNDHARQILAGRFQLMGSETPAPTFISRMVPFPWEVLYQGENYHDGDPEMFWGLRYSPARILTPQKDISQYVHEQTLPSDMLFCLHHLLRHTHEIEWPTIERLVRMTEYDKFRLLGPFGKIADRWDGETLLTYLYKASHNMVHFACHCEQVDAGEDALLISLIDDQGVEGSPQIIRLETYTFIDCDGKFQRQPLVFLNACHSAGGVDELRKILNLPSAFIERGAAAVIATACPVPDRFAAAFARKFYEFFLHGKEVIINVETGEKKVSLLTIGEALRETRWHFLHEHHNPLGLAYGLYSPAFYRLAQPPMVRDVN